LTLKKKLTCQKLFWVQNYIQIKFIWIGLIKPDQYTQELKLNLKYELILNSKYSKLK